MSNLKNLGRSAFKASNTLLGLDPRRVFSTLRGAPRFIRDAREYRARASEPHFPFKWSTIQPMLHDWRDQAGEVGGHYFHQDLWFARKIHLRRPASHLDIGSRIDGFIAHLLAFMPVTVIDIRALESTIEGLTFLQQDATKLSGLTDDSVDSISSLHAIEHFGLGRYGDPIAPDACFEAMRALARVTKPGGRLYVSVPVGIERLEFNAQRVFAPSTVLESFRQLRLVSFAAVDDAGRLRVDATPESVKSARMACGLFEFTKDRR